MPQTLLDRQDLASQSQGQRPKDATPSRKPFDVLNCDVPVLETPQNLVRAADSSPVDSAEPAAAEPVLAKGAVSLQIQPIASVRVPHHAGSQQISSGSSFKQNRSGRGSFGTAGSSRSASQTDGMRPPSNPGSMDTAASSSSVGVAHADAGGAASVLSQNSAGQQHMRTALDSGSTSPAISRAESSSEGKPGLSGDASSKASRAASKPSRAKAGASRAGKQKKSHGPSAEVRTILKLVLKQHAAVSAVCMV